jgi:hypothetical protein
MSKITIKHYLNTRLKPEIDDKIKIYPIYLSITFDRMNIRTPSNLKNGTETQITEKDFLKNKIDKAILFKMNYEIDLIKRSVENFKTDEKLNQLRNDYKLLYGIHNYKSKNERLNILNSYIDYQTHPIFGVVSSFLESELKKVFNEKISKDLIDLGLIDDIKLKLLISTNNPKFFDLIVKYNLGYQYELYYILWSRFHSYLAYQGKVYGYDMPYIDWKQGIGQPLFKEYLKTYSRSTDNWKTDFFNDENIENCINIINKIIDNENYFEKILKIYE